MATEQIVLAAMIILPLVGGIAISLIPESRSSWARPSTLVLTAVLLVMAGWMWSRFNGSVPGMQFEVNLPWISGLGTAFHLGVDGISLPMVFLTALLTCLAAWPRAASRTASVSTSR